MMMVPEICAMPVEELSGVVAQHVHLAGVRQQLQRSVHSRQTDGLTAAANSGMYVLGGAEPLVVRQRANNGTPLGRVASVRCAHLCHYATAGARTARSFAHDATRTTT